MYLFLHYAVHNVEITEIYFTLAEKIFRQITYLVISLVKLLISRNFCQKCVIVNSRNFHTVCVTGILSHAFLAKLS